MCELEDIFIRACELGFRKDWHNVVQEIKTPYSQAKYRYVGAGRYVTHQRPFLYSRVTLRHGLLEFHILSQQAIYKKPMGDLPATMKLFFVPNNTLLEQGTLSQKVIASGFNSSV